MVHLWQVAIFSVCTGMVMAVDMPVRQSFVKDMSSPRDLLNAIALNSIIFNLARIFGPTVAGWVIKIPAVGIPGALYINAASFLAVIVGLLLIRIPPTVRAVSREQHLAGPARRFSLCHPSARHSTADGPHGGLCGFRLLV